MTEARKLADQGEDAAPDGTLIWSREQTEGRGRRGNNWISPKGNFYSSLIVRPDVPAARAAELSFVTGCAVFDTIGEVCDPGYDCRLKWPNDILLNDGKVGGLLLETKAEAGKSVEYVIIGLGVNLKSHPKDTPYPATDFVDQGQAVPDTVFLEAYARHFMEWASKWVDEGFAPIRAQWKWRAAGIGKEITVRLSDQTLEGVFEDIAEDGALMLSQNGKIRHISAGDVYFTPAKEA
ncbi:MAG: biotin--[acetyl-CoA-carboxylase] ligase [Rhodospirillales bacterium]|nr:biotin--[acetyl-CoA-carboxylase] ligase [Rhodospirillales bacterium]